MFSQDDASFQVVLMSPSLPFLLQGPYPGCLWETYLPASVKPLIACSGRKWGHWGHALKGTVEVFLFLYSLHHSRHKGSSPFHPTLPPWSTTHQGPKVMEPIKHERKHPNCEPKYTFPLFNLIVSFFIVIEHCLTQLYYKLILISLTFPHLQYCEDTETEGKGGESYGAYQSHLLSYKNSGIA